MVLKTISTPINNTIWKKYIDEKYKSKYKIQSKYLFYDFCGKYYAGEIDNYWKVYSELCPNLNGAPGTNRSIQTFDTGIVRVIIASDTL